MGVPPSFFGRGSGLQWGSRRFRGRVGGVPLNRTYVRYASVVGCCADVGCCAVRAGGIELARAGAALCAQGWVLTLCCAGVSGALCAALKGATLCAVRRFLASLVGCCAGAVIARNVGC